MPRPGTSRHLCIYTYIVAYLLIILESRVCCILYFILFHYMSTKISNTIIIMEIRKPISIKKKYLTRNYEEKSRYYEIIIALLREKISLLRDNYLVITRKDLVINRPNIGAQVIWHANSPGYLTIAGMLIAQLVSRVTDALVAVFLQPWLPYHCRYADRRPAGIPCYTHIGSCVPTALVILPLQVC